MLGAWPVVGALVGATVGAGASVFAGAAGADVGAAGAVPHAESTNIRARASTAIWKIDLRICFFSLF